MGGQEMKQEILDVATRGEANLTRYHCLQTARSWRDARRLRVVGFAYAAERIRYWLDKAAGWRRLEKGDG